MTKLLFLGGPSGSGKSHFCKEYLALKKRWLHLEIDQYPRDGIEEHGLRAEWDGCYHNLTPEPLHNELLRRAQKSKYVVLSFPGNLIFSDQHLFAGCQFFSFAYLYGTPANCLKAFLEREQATPRGLDRAHWDTNNYVAYGLLSRSINHPLLIQAFDRLGGRRNPQTIYSDIARLMKK